VRSRTPPDLAGRCPRCFLPEALCLCEAVAPARTRVEVVVVRHVLERFKSSNTARWALLALPNATLVDHGGQEGPTELSERVAGGWLLYPGTAPSVPAGPPPSRLVVVDGSWSQARRMVHRLAPLVALPRLSLPPPPPEWKRLRQPKLEEGMSTLEAIACGLLALGEREAAERLSELHALAVQRASSIRGRRH
jgi:DTW domain-containing protein YfiP